MFPASTEAFSETPISKQGIVCGSNSKRHTLKRFFFSFFFLLLFSSLAVRSEKEIILLLHSSYQDHNCLFFFLSPIAFSHSPKTLDCLIFPLLYRYFPHLFFFSFLAASCATSSWNQNKLPSPKQTFFQSKLGSSLAPRASTESPGAPK